MEKFSKLSIAATTMYYLETEAENPDEEIEQIELKVTVDESNDHLSNAITNNEDGNDFSGELELADPIEKENVPESVLEKFEDRIEEFGKEYIRIMISQDTSEDSD